jgi:hypothetical protein
VAGGLPGPWVSRVQEALAASLGAPVRVAGFRLLKSRTRNDVWRVAVEGDGAPASVVVKRFKTDRDRGLDEWASLAYLSERGLAPALAPRFLAGDREARAFVMEDLGPGQSLEQALLGEDAEATAEALALVAGQTGRLHAATLAAHRRYDEVRDGLAPRTTTVALAAAAFLREGRPVLDAWLDAAGVPAPPGLDTAVDLVVGTVADPGPFTAFTHGDMAPGNTHLATGRVALLDFEYGGVRHALYDALLWTLFCPFPPALIERAERAYRAALEPACAAARDGDRYARERAIVAAWRTLDMLHWFRPDVLVADRPWAPGLTLHPALLHHLARFETMAASVRPLGALVDALSRLRPVLERRWPAAAGQVFVWPAFRSPR